MFKKVGNFCKWIVKECKTFANYCKACYDELAHKTTWPTMAELQHSAVVVLSASLVIALIVFAMDSLFRWVMSMVYPR